ncbi:MAG: ribosome-associated translation inhibitor RaiA [Saprospiraceae bacterium]|nr:ribosome-associated translation inhibitor RaiA [Saprospiraceae bacterium]
MEIQIQSIHFDADKKLKDFIQKKVHKLSTFYDRIVDAEVFLRLEKQGASIKNKVAEIKLNVPGNTLYATQTTRVFEESVDLATDSLRRQLKRHKEKLRN